MSVSPFQGERRRGTAGGEALHMLGFMHEALTVDTYTIVVVALLSGWAGVLLMHALARTFIALISIPAFVFSALISNYAFCKHGAGLTGAHETDVVIASTIGIMVALLGMLIVTRLTSAFAGVRVVRHQRLRRA